MVPADPARASSVLPGAGRAVRNRVGVLTRTLASEPGGPLLPTAPGAGACSVVLLAPTSDTPSTATHCDGAGVAAHAVGRDGGRRRRPLSFLGLDAFSLGQQSY